MKASQVILFGRIETNTNWLNPGTKEEFKERTISARLQTAKCEFSTSALPSSSNYTGRHGNNGDHRKWCGRAEQDSGEDPSGMGCWSFMTLKGKNSVTITIITAYRSSVSSINASTWGWNDISPTTCVNVKTRETRDEKSKPKGTICYRHNYFHKGGHQRHGWLTNMSKVLGKHNFQIEISNSWSPGLQCYRDSMIMQILAERGLSKHRLFHLSTCNLIKHRGATGGSCAQRQKQGYDAIYS